MESFKDAEGRTWKIDLRFSHILAIEQEVGLKAHELMESDFFSDPGQFARALWICVRSQAEERKLSFDDFIDALFGEEIARAYMALTLELFRFFSRRTSETERLIEQIRQRARQQMEQSLTPTDIVSTAEQSSDSQPEPGRTSEPSSTAASPSGNSPTTPESGSETSGTTRPR